MFRTRPCGCKGQRSCKICEAQYGAHNLCKPISKENSCLYCNFCNRLWPGWENKHPKHYGQPVVLPGIEIIPDFITVKEEDDLVKEIDSIPWDLSQSGRFKQNFGPKCNFKKKKVTLGGFSGYPKFTEFIQRRFNDVSILKDFQTAEQCSLDYSTERGSSIDPHIDDCWIWGERIPTLSLLSDSILTLIKYTGPKTKYNLMDTLTYPLVINEYGFLKSKSKIAEEFEILKNRDCNEDINLLKLISDQNLVNYEVIRVPMPRRSLLVLYGLPRYEWEHCILREDITERRICVTYRELTPTFSECGTKADIGKEIIKMGQKFWSVY